MKKLSGTLALLFLLAPVICTPVLANSSWVWLTDTPVNMLPWAIVLTLVIECAGIGLISGTGNRKRLVLLVAAANLLSFAGPYLFRALSFSEVGYSFRQSIDRSPGYMVVLGYFLLTIAIEIPVVYHWLKGNVRSRKRLMASIVGMNAVTTIAVAVIERSLYHGFWA